MYDIGIDLGGTNIAAGVVNEKKQIVCQKSVKTNLPKTPEQIIEDIASLIEDLVKETQISVEQIQSIGIGVPGSVNTKTGMLEYANNLNFTAVPICMMLEERVHIKTYMDNDANAAAWGEFLIGEYDTDSFFVVTIGTGIGGGIILNRKLYRGFNEAAGEFGHMTLKVDGPECNCGRHGCFENYASATALVDMTKQAMTRHKDSILWNLVDGEINQVNGKVFFDAIEKQDSVAQQVLEKYTNFLSEGLADIINLFQPEFICLAGGITKAGKYFLDMTKQKVKNKVYPGIPNKETKVLIAKAEAEAGIIGAALLRLAD